MLKREIVLPPERFYPPDEWRLRETRYSDEFAERTETIFSLGNGFIGIRGSFEEGRPALRPGTFVNGFHETWPIVHAEEAPRSHGRARRSSTCPTRRSSSSTWTMNHCSCLLRASMIARGSSTCGPGH
jgi:alpha,alpha-trehalose phosphorylase